MPPCSMPTKGTRCLRRAAKPPSSTCPKKPIRFLLMAKPIRWMPTIRPRLLSPGPKGMFSTTTPYARCTSLSRTTTTKTASPTGRGSARSRMTGRCFPAGTKTSISFPTSTKTTTAPCPIPFPTTKSRFCAITSIGPNSSLALTSTTTAGSTALRMTSWPTIPISPIGAGTTSFLAFTSGPRRACWWGGSTSACSRTTATTKSRMPCSPLTRTTPVWGGCGSSIGSSGSRTPSPTLGGRHWPSSTRPRRRWWRISSPFPTRGSTPRGWG